MAIPNQSAAIDQPHLAAIYDRLEGIVGSLRSIDDRLSGAATRALGSEPERSTGSGTGGSVKAVPDGAVGKLNDLIDAASVLSDRISGSVARLERVV